MGYTIIDCCQIILQCFPYIGSAFRKMYLWLWHCWINMSSAHFCLKTRRGCFFMMFLKWTYAL